jgi:hypothetical protein
MSNMTTLIIHPDDRSTDFLKDIYRNIWDATVITKNITRARLHELIRSHDQIIMLGHGSPNGLFNVSSIGEHSVESRYTICDSEVLLLQDKQCVFIWCHASEFVRRHGLKGLSSGMFISEVGEARYCRVSGSQKQVSHSNEVFARALGKALSAQGNYQQILEQVTSKYQELVPENAVVQYNLERWQLIG